MRRFSSCRFEDEVYLAGMISAVLNATGPSTVRLLPALTISRAQVEDALGRLGAVLGGM